MIHQTGELTSQDLKERPKTTYNIHVGQSRKVMLKHKCLMLVSFHVRIAPSFIFISNSISEFLFMSVLYILYQSFDKHVTSQGLQEAFSVILETLSGAGGGLCTILTKSNPTYANGVFLPVFL